jgi:hypothetical protein
MRLVEHKKLGMRLGIYDSSRNKVKLKILYSVYGTLYSAFGIRAFGIRQIRHSAIRQFGNSAIRQFGNSAIRQFGNSAIRQFGNSAIRQFGIRHSAFGNRDTAGGMTIRH